VEWWHFNTNAEMEIKPIYRHRSNGSHKGNENNNLLNYRRSVLERKKTIKGYQKSLGKDFSWYCDLFGLDEMRELTIMLDTAFANAETFERTLDCKTRMERLSDLSDLEVLYRKGREDFEHLSKAMESLHMMVQASEEKKINIFLTSHSYGISDNNYGG